MAAMSPRACVSSSWSVNHPVQLASLCTSPWSIAASSPSEYEKPPTGKAGDASQISCSRVGVSVAMRVVVPAAAVVVRVLVGVRM